MNRNDRISLLYVGLTWLVGWLLAVMVLALGGLAGVGGLLIPLFLLVPALVAIGFRLAEPRPRWERAGLDLGRVSDFLIAWWGPALAVGICFLLTLSLGLGRVDTRLQAVSAEELAASGAGGSGYIFSTFFMNLILMPFLGLPFSLGSELGWRSYLMPRLLDRGRWVAAAGAGLAAGGFHLPLVYLGLAHPGRELPGGLVLVAYHGAIGLGLGWLYLRSRSIWIVGIAAAALEHAPNSFLLIVKGSTLLGSSKGLVGILVLGGLGALLLFLTGPSKLASYRDILPRTLYPDPSRGEREPWIWPE